LIRVAFIAVLTPLLSGWTCSALFVSCQGVAKSQVTSLSPDAIPSDAESVLLTADGRGFTPQSQIMWNGNALRTKFMDSHHLQTTSLSRPSTPLVAPWGTMSRFQWGLKHRSMIWDVQSAGTLPHWF